MKLFGRTVQAIREVGNEFEGTIMKSQEWTGEEFVEVWQTFKFVVRGGKPMNPRLVDETETRYG